LFQQAELWRFAALDYTKLAPPIWCRLSRLARCDCKRSVQQFEFMIPPSRLKQPTKEAAN
jgi:hypothetical protein